ncbi:MAG: hypothetical protein NTW11_03030 [Candidatus Staskawiczbacteria bacterium]|nr:hypothetical protein [Candidatus Staskawiczbacteria bacterium]
MKLGAKKGKVREVTDAVVKSGHRYHVSKLSATQKVISVDNKGELDPVPFEAMEGVEKVYSILVELPKPFGALSAP